MTPSPNPIMNNQQPALFEAPSTFAAPPPAGPPPGRSPLDGRTDERENPFSDRNEAAHPGTADLQAPLQPQLFGLPPQGISQPQVPPSGYVSSRPIGADPGEVGGTREPEPEPEPQPAKPRYRF